ncbi:MAG TPA: hypothetical protein VHY32_05950 [Caulobacteraceae bacterium]|nr:hypothetical protein [Caulobacteraceae bacterium]
MTDAEYTGSILTETEVERLLDDLYDRADEYDDIEYSDRPISEMIGRIIKDLTDAIDWKLWTPGDWKPLEIPERKRVACSANRRHHRACPGGP